MTDRTSNEYLRTALEHVRASAQTGTSDAGVVISFAAFQAVREALETATPVATCDTPDFCRNIRGSCKEVPPQVETGDELASLRAEVAKYKAWAASCEPLYAFETPVAWMSSINPELVTSDENEVLCWNNPAIPLYRRAEKTSDESRWAEAHRTDDDPHSDLPVELNP